MNTQQQHNFLMERYGRIPEHYSLYLLPDDKRGGQEYVYTCMEAENGEVLFFEFDFSAASRFSIPWEELENSILHHCSTCEWDYCRGKGTSYCKATEEISSGACPDCEIGPEAVHPAVIAYYKQLHERHYGKISVSV